MSVPILPARRVGPASLVVACLVLCTAALAQEPPLPAPPAEQVVITGQRLSTAPGLAAARAEAERVAGGANIVAAEDYAGGRASNLLDVFALAPGLFVQPRFGAEEARLSIRGSGLQRTFHMRGISLLQDGVPITLADGSGDFQTVEPLALAYTEVLRGANALQYGGTTLGGSINFVSPSGRDGAGWRPRIEAGSFGYRRALLGAGDTRGTADYFFSLSDYETDGYRAWSRQQNRRLSGNLGLLLREGLQTRFYIGALDSDSQLPGALSRAQLRADPQQGNAVSLAGRQKRDYQLFRLANRTALELDGRVLEAFASYSYKDLWHPIFQVLQQRSQDYSLGLRYVDSRALGSFGNRLTLGATRSWNRVTDDRFANVAGRAGARTAQSLQHSSNLTAYAQDELALAAQLTLIAGAQWTESQREYRDLFHANGDQGLNAGYARVSPKLGLLWQPAAAWSLFGNLSDSFEPPSFGELAGGPGVDLLDAQRARTLEIGTRGAAGLLQWDVVAYSARLHGELLSLNTPTGQPLGTVNAGRTLHRGVELGAEVALAPTLSWRSSYLWNDFRFDGDPVRAERRLPGIPQHFYRGELRYTPRASWYLALTTEWSPRKYAVDMANTLYADGYALWGIKLGRSLEAGFSWFVEGRNLGDRRYAATTGVIADARGLDAAQFYPGDGRAAYAGLSWSSQ